ncbi:MAG: DUF4363 domain-containing protein [Chroococcidiopsidaceae cyanobacterium CP_BM_RX_35]|nr:DUF4363 domain-containing protein [Chroococcidiopsidaceae cyanobacterium CP_BM_RX_35]
MVQAHYRIWIASILTLLALTACNNPNQPASNIQSPAATTPASSAATADPKTTFALMKEIVAKTTASVKAGHFDKAKQEFQNFDDGYWSKVEDGVKAKSATTYKQVEDDMDNVTNGLKAAQPNKAKVLTALQSLSKSINSYTSTL